MQTDFATFEWAWLNATVGPLDEDFVEAVLDRPFAQDDPEPDRRDSPSSGQPS